LIITDAGLSSVLACGQCNGLCTKPQGVLPTGKHAVGNLSSVGPDLVREGVSKDGLTRGGVNASVFRGFLQRMIAGMTRRILGIVDGYRMHKAKRVPGFVEENSQAIALFVLATRCAGVEPGWAGVSIHPNQGCQGHGTNQGKPRKHVERVRQRFAKGTRSRGRILGNTGLRLRKSMRLCF
jgi:hypothetical protein